MTLPEANEALNFLPPAVRATGRLIHIGAGLLAIASGYLAVAAPKGRPVHRAAGTAFFLAMAVMASAAAVLGLNAGQSGNVVAGVFTLYLISTAWMAAKRPEGVVGRFELVAILFALGIAALSALRGWQVSQDPSTAGGVPPQASYVFAVVTALAAAADLSVLARRGLQGPDRIARHLWRMCAAFFVAAGSYFLGQPKFVPELLRGWPAAVLALLPLAALLFWLIRVRFRPWNGKAAPAPLQRAAA
jgi:uncharacterized membrane protein